METPNKASLAPEAATPALAPATVQTVVPFDPNTIIAALQAALQGQGQVKEPTPIAETAKELKARLALLRETHAFQSGDLVCWKPGLKNRKFPQENQPAIVVEVLPEPLILDSEPSGSPYFREELDIVLGVIADDGTLAVFHFDKRRFAPLKQ